MPDETGEIAVELLHSFSESEAWVPALWWCEIRNGLVVSERRGRIAESGTREFLQRVAALPIRTDLEPDESLLMELARNHGLTVYDAAYLELAQRRGLVLATLDVALAKAARAIGVVVAGARKRR